jgi:hypothetical protein
MRCLPISNQYEEQCVLMLPKFHTMTKMKIKMERLFSLNDFVTWIFFIELE